MTKAKATSTSLVPVVEENIDTSKLTVVTTTTNVKEDQSRNATQFELGRVLYNLLSPFYEFGILATALEAVMHDNPTTQFKNTSDDVKHLVTLVLNKLIETRNNRTNNSLLVSFSVADTKIDTRRKTVIVTTLLAPVVS